MPHIKFGCRLYFLVLFVFASGCAKENSDWSQESFCPALQLPVITTENGKAQVFIPDPMTSSNQPSLSPFSTDLDNYRQEVNLAHLSGVGVLTGQYIHVVNGTLCGGQVHAFSTSNAFSYSHSDSRFQEAMAYYFGDEYQSYIDQLGYLTVKTPVVVIAHCRFYDNAYFVRGLDSEGNNVGEVCLGDSSSVPGASYSDDASVTIHELQHATTVDNYSMKQQMNQLWYDEAGALNEAISDFMSLVYLDSNLPSNSFDPRVFSRWALGTFDSKNSHARGAHLCPVYDSHYPNCDRYPQFEVPSSGNGNSSSISFVYPDGLGWPYAGSYRGFSALSELFVTFSSQEEIHNAGIVMVGALWDLYSAVKANHPSQLKDVDNWVTQLVLEAVRALPLPNLTTNHSPVNFLGFASNLLALSNKVPGLTSQDSVSIQQVLVKRGLVGGATINNSDWTAVGTGKNVDIVSTPTPGVYVLDDPAILQRWLDAMDADSKIVTQDLSTGLNSQLDPGEVAAVWFDIKNTSSVTAGGVLVTVSSLDSEVTLLDDKVNIGYLSSATTPQVQVMYEKINGTNIVSALNSLGISNRVPVGNSYFNSNPFFNRSFRTAVWVKVSSTAAHGKVVRFRVTAKPSNGVSSTTEFSVKIR